MMLQNHVRQHALRFIVLIGILVQLLGLGLTSTVQAEVIVEPAFAQQWRTTDAPVREGRVSRTYFWGPEPFGHTNEVYAESPNNGQRRVQYFDKARMELSKKAGQDPNLVTNGLLTVELVTGRLQVGDSTFLERRPAQNPVAGDAINNDAAPTYATYFQSKLAFGVPEAVAAPDRTGQVVAEALDKAGQVSRLAQPPRATSYARFFAQTGHNVADVFMEFFQATPLGPDVWLPVMGLPISEPFWAKDKVVVAGKPQDVLIQLFERRALTYTPTNPAGYQVEMGNIGQHYFAWRYNFDVRDELPGNYRLIYAQGNSLYAQAIRQPTDRIKLGDAPASLSGVVAIGGSRAVVGAGGRPYLVDLSRPRAPKALPIPPGLQLADPPSISASADGRHLALRLFGQAGDRSVVEVFELASWTDDNLTINGSFTAYDASNGYEPCPIVGQRLAVSPDGRYLAIAEARGVNVVELAGRTTRRIVFSDMPVQSRFEWVGTMGKLLVTSAPYTTSCVEGAVLRQVDATTGEARELLQAPQLLGTTVSPDGNYFAVLMGAGGGSSFQHSLSFRAFTNPQTSIAPVYQQETSGRTSNPATFGSWSADGTYLLVRTSATGTAGANYRDDNLVSIVTGKAIQANKANGIYNSIYNFRIGNPFYTLTANDEYKGPEQPAQLTVAVSNIDGSEQTTLLDLAYRRGDGTPIPLAGTAQIVQVVLKK